MLLQAVAEASCCEVAEEEEKEERKEKEGGSLTREIKGEPNLLRDLGSATSLRPPTPPQVKFKFLTGAHAWFRTTYVF